MIKYTHKWHQLKNMEAGGDERSKVQTVHVKTGLLQVRRCGCRVVWRSRLTRIKSALGSERREKCGRRHDGIAFVGWMNPSSRAKFQNPANAECLVFRARHDQ